MHYHALCRACFFSPFLLRYLPKVLVQTTYGSSSVRALVASFYAHYHTPDVAQRRCVIMRKLFLWWIRERCDHTEILHTRARWNRES